MQNLAGNLIQKNNMVITSELAQAGIPLVFHSMPKYSEVKTNITGEIRDFTFERNWYYWVVKGKLPLSVARKLYEDHKDLNIRVDGHCGNPHPYDWARPDMKTLEFIFRESPDILNEERRNNGDFRYVELYHVDTLEGLKVLADVIKVNTPDWDRCWKDPD